MACPEMSRSIGEGTLLLYLMWVLSLKMESIVKKWTPHRVAAKSADEEELKKPFLKTSKQPYRITIADEPGEKADLTRLPAPESQKIFRMKKRTSTADNEEEMECLASKNVLRMQGGHKPFSYVAASFSPEHYLMCSRFCLVWTPLL